MLKRSVNELELAVEIVGRSPLLVKDGRYTREVKEQSSRGDKEWPAMMFICRNTFDDSEAGVLKLLRQKAYSRLNFYLPGSSVRGAWRSHLEKVLRSLDDSRQVVCDPLIEGGSGNSCSAELLNVEQIAPTHAYRGSCPVCKLFGDAAQGSRISFSDGELRGGGPATVDNIAIRRQTGSVAAPFKSLVLENAKFELTIRFRNFELWQVGLLGHLFEDLKTGIVPLGSGKNKGFGVVGAHATSIQATYFGRTDSMEDGRLRGIAEVLKDDKLADRYGFAPRVEAPPAIASDPAEPKALWRHTRKVSDPTAFWAAVRPCFNERVWNGFGTLAERKAAANG